MATAMSFYAHRIAHNLQLRPGMKVLDVGCGIGGPAREIAKFAGCEVVGITISQTQVDRAVLLTAMEGLQDKCTFLRGDFLDMPFMEGGFDAAYAVEATCHAPSLLTVFKEVRSALKPGARFATVEWVLTPEFDPENKRHIDVRNRIERGNSLVNLHTSQQARDMLGEAGFEIESEEDYTRHFDYAKYLMETNSRLESGGPHAGVGTAMGFQSPILIPYKTGPRPAPPSSIPLPHPLPLPKTSYRPWTFLLQGHHHLATTWTDWWTAFKLSPFMRKTCYGVIYVGERVGLWDKGVLEAMNTMAICVDSVVDGWREEIFSPCWWFVCRKVGNGVREGAVVHTMDETGTAKEDLSANR